MNPYANWYMWRLQHPSNIQAYHNAGRTVLLSASGGNSVLSGNRISLKPGVNNIVVPNLPSATLAFASPFPFFAGGAAVASAALVIAVVHSRRWGREGAQYPFEGCIGFLDQCVIALLISDSTSVRSLESCEPETSGSFRIVSSSSRSPMFTRLVLVE